MKKQIIFLTVLAASMQLFAQNSRMWIFFTDKGQNIEAQLAHPEQFLSATSLERRSQKGISLDESDLPVCKAYTQALQQQNCTILSASRWLNAVAIEANPQQLAAIQQLKFVSGVQTMHSMEVTRTFAKDETVASIFKGNDKEPGDVFDYGKARVQAAMLNVPAMHRKGITGRGVKVAVFDAGFEGGKTIDVFDSLWAQKRIVAWHDFVDNDNDVFDTPDSHGTNVLSCIAANLPGQMVGIAPHATFYLARTEQSKGETQREEYNWVKAMEWADSIGVDVIHSSLGYSKFDDGVGSYTYKDMDGNTSVCTKAADRAAKKGIIVTLSAGNEGNDEWKYICAPSDADSVLCVGAVNAVGKRANFSSMGPSSDGQVKPDVCAMGRNTTVATPENTIGTSDGTSFSGPIMAGFEILLKQSNPKRNNMDIIQATRLSGDQYNFPDGEYGYGIPNVMVADSLLKNVKDLSTVKMPGTEKPVRGAKPVEKAVLKFAISPKTKINTSTNSITLETTGSNTFKIVEVRQNDRKIVLPASAISISPNKITINSTYLMAGEHYLHIETSDYEENFKFTK